MAAGCCSPTGGTVCGSTDWRRRRVERRGVQDGKGHGWRPCPPNVSRCATSHCFFGSAGAAGGLALVALGTDPVWIPAAGFTAGLASAALGAVPLAFAAALA